MAKKSFKDNPAYQFISENKPVKVEDQPTAESEIQEQEIEPINDVEATTASQAEEQEEIVKLPTSARPPKGYKVNPAFIEKKSRRLQLVLQPTLYERIKKAAKKSKLSVNEYVHRILDEATREG